MKIYFAGSIFGAEADKEIYLKTIECLRKYGEVLTEHVGSKAQTDQSEKGLTIEEIYDRDINWLKEADVVVADVSVPSLGVGYEIAKAEEMGKKILFICKKLENGKKLSAMIAGNKNIKTEYYQNFPEIENILESFLQK